MRWMWIIPGLLMAVAAVCLLRAWSQKGRRAHKGEISLMAAVKRVAAAGGAVVPVTFVARGQEIALPVPQNLARQLRPGLRGVLTYAGSEFIYFVPREELFDGEGDAHLPQVS